MAWTAAIIDSEGNACQWASISPESGDAGEDQTITVTLQENEDISNSRTATVTISTEKGASSSITIAPETVKLLYLDPAEIGDYEEVYLSWRWNPHFENGPDAMLRHDSYYSWHRMKQSEHFFVFWSPEFGNDPTLRKIRVVVCGWILMIYFRKLNNISQLILILLVWLFLENPCLMTIKCRFI